MTKVIDLTGKVFGKLTVLRRGPNQYGMACWVCKCECGDETLTRGGCLRRGESTACRKCSDFTGSQEFKKSTPITYKDQTKTIKEWAIELGMSVGALVQRFNRGWDVERAMTEDVVYTKHKMADTKEYNAWRHMKARCSNEKLEKYKYYGGKGILVCERWKDSFEEFYKDLGPAPDNNSTLDRIDPDAHYCCGVCQQCKENGWKSNCRWASWTEQAQNKTNNHLITYNNETRTITEWERITGIDRHLINKKLSLGWSAEDIFNSK